MHFAAALGWLLIGSALLVWLAPRLAQGAVFEPPVFALVHVLMLGVVATAIFGTLQQFVPGGLGVPLRSVRLGDWAFGLMQSGVACLVLGFFRWSGPLQGLGWLLILGAVFAVSRNVLRARRASVHGQTVGLFVTVAQAALGAGMLVASARLGETLGWWHVDRLSLLATHLLLGLAGFGTLTVIGVGSRMLPTFLNGPGDDTRWLAAQLWSTVLALVLFGAGAVGGWPLLRVAGGGCLLGAGSLGVLLGVRWFRRRTRSLDPALWHIASAFVALGASVPLGAWLLVGDGFAFTHWVALVAVLLLGWLATLVVGVAAKILPHMSYMRLAPVMPGFRARGTPNRLLHDDWQHASALLLTLGWSGIATSVVRGDAIATRFSALLWSSGVLLTAANYAQMYIRGRWPAAPEVPMRVAR